MKKVKEGDIVKITDWSYMIGWMGGRIWFPNEFSLPGTEKFRVIRMLFSSEKHRHDIILEQLETKEQFLHSSPFVQVVRKKKTYKERILKLVQLKKENLLERNLPVTYAHEADFEEIREEWTEEECERIWKSGFERHSFCPWCEFNEIRRRRAVGNACSRCNYGKRHGECFDYGSDWDRIGRFNSKSGGGMQVFSETLRKELMHRAEEED